MSSASPNSAQADAAALDELSAATAQARGLVEQQVAMLTRLAQVGLTIAGAVEQRALEEAKAPGGPDAPFRCDLAYARVARAVRLTLALQSRALKDLVALDEAADRVRSRPPAAPLVERRPDPQGQRRERIARIVQRVIEAEWEGDDVERLSDAAWERLEDEDVYGDLTARPIGETVARICEDLELSPDWTRLAREAWAVAEARSGAEGSPFVAASPMLAARVAARPPPRAGAP
jgi:hypothetical protein